MKLSAVICTHNPRSDYLGATLASIRSQKALDASLQWELLVIDNGSRTQLSDQVDLSWHPHGRVIREERLGLTYARLRSFHESLGEFIIYIDDDNILSSNYFSEVIAILENNPKYGAIGGKSLPVYEASPPPWFSATGISLACRDLGDDVLEASWPAADATARSYPDCAPIGAGMAVRRIAYADYVNAAAVDPRRTALGRRGTDLASGEDNDMILSILSQGWGVAYRPELILQHLIPAGRLTPEYLKRYARSSNRTWVQVLDIHGIRPWPAVSSWTIPLRVLRAALRTQPWRSETHAIRYMGQRGLLEGRAIINK